jgi:SAM-dependent methyltransferase
VNDGTSTPSFANVYDDPARAAAYATLEYPGTYYLAFRDLPAIIAEHVAGRRALDFGCGAGRSTRFLKQLGFEARGVDISRSMIELATRLDPAGAYACIEDGDLRAMPPAELDLVLCAFTFDNIPDVARRQELLSDLRRLLKPRGRVILLGSTPEIYWHEWASFTTRAFPENRLARSGDTVRIVMKDVADARPVLDLLWLHEDYLELFAASELELLATARPLGRMDESCEWVSELSVAPWVIYVLGPAPRGVS